MFNILDAVIIVLLLFGAFIGLKRGLLREVVMLIGTIVILVVAYYLKNPIADLLFNIFPFIDFKDFTSGGTIINILFFEMIAFIIAFVLLLFLFRLALKSSKVIQKFLDKTIVFGLISRILGAIIGFLHYYIITFIIIFILSIPLFSFDFGTSKLATNMLNKTPFLSDFMNKGLESVNGINNLNISFKNNTKSDEYNIIAVDYMLKGKIITVTTVDNLVEDGKLNYNGVNTVIDKYR